MENWNVQLVGNSSRSLYTNVEIKFCPRKAEPEQMFLYRVEIVIVRNSIVIRRILRRNFLDLCRQSIPLHGLFAAHTRISNKVQQSLKRTIGAISFE